jgi:hypothetical protein
LGDAFNDFIIDKQTSPTGNNGLYKAMNSWRIECDWWSFIVSLTIDTSLVTD